jgi:hypothetical protein
MLVISYIKDCETHVLAAVIPICNGKIFRFNCEWNFVLLGIQALLVSIFLSTLLIYNASGIAVVFLILDFAQTFS